MLPLHSVSHYNSKPNKMQHQATVVTLGGVEEEGKVKLALQVLKKFQQLKQETDCATVSDYILTVYI